MARNRKKRVRSAGLILAVKGSGSRLPEVVRASDGGGNREARPVVRRGCGGVLPQLHLALA